MLCWILLLSGVVLASSVPEVDSAVASFRMCGANLADFLALVCKDNGYYEPFANNRHTRSIGIVDECCKRACSLRVWQSYCAPPDSSSASSTAESSNTIETSDEGRLRTQGRDGLHRYQAQVRDQGQSHRPRPNRSYLVNS